MSRAFGAAAWLESFKGAAVELDVTQVAVTRHIKWLEGGLRVTLFERLHRGVRHTEIEWQLCEKLVPAFRVMKLAVEHVRERFARDPLLIGSEAAFAKRWLVHGGRLQHPARAPDSGDDFIGIGNPGEGYGAGIVHFQVVIDRVLGSKIDRNTPRSSRRSMSVVKNPFAARWWLFELEFRLGIETPLTISGAGALMNVRSFINA